MNPNVKTFGDALYFAFITVTTVGYGDVVPVTPGGRVLSGVLIFVGIGLVGFASSQLTARWLRRGTQVASASQVLEELKENLVRQEQLLRQISERMARVEVRQAAEKGR